MSAAYQTSRAGIALVRQLKGNVRDKALLHDATCGLHSGIPKCCVAFYIAIWSPALIEIERLMSATGNSRRPSTANVGYSEMIWKVAHRRHGVGYVPCPACLLKRRFVKVKSCCCYDMASPLPLSEQEGK